MSYSERRSTTRSALAAGAALLLAFALLSCGTSDDGKGGITKDGNARDGSAPARNDRSSGAAAREGDESAGERRTRARSSGSGAERRIHAVYARFADAAAEQDAPATCATLTRAAQRKFGMGKGCIERFEDLFSSSSPRRPTLKPFIARLKVMGNTARAGAKTRTSNLYPVDFAKEDGKWKISGDGSGR